MRARQRRGTNDALMTALLVTENFPPRIGGSSRWLWELYRRMPSSDVAVAAGSWPGAAAFDRTHGLRIDRLPLSFRDLGLLSPRSAAAYARAALTVRSLARRRIARVVHCGRVLPEGWLALACRRPFACYAHGEDMLSYGTSRQLTWMARCVVRHAAALIANSHHTAMLLQRDWDVDPQRITILAPGVDTSRFSPAPHDQAVRRALGWAERFVVLTVGRLQRRKGHDYMIDAVDRLRRDFPDVLYAIVGDGDDRAALEERVRRAGLTAHVRFHGAVDDDQLIRCYQQCDLFALPNRTVGVDLEGFGIVLLEAQACGRAVLAGDSGGTAEAVQDGRTGVIADCNRPESLAVAVAALMRAPERRAELGTAGRRWVSDTFDFDRNARHAAETIAGALPS